MIFLFEVPERQKIGDQNGDECRERGAANAEFWPRPDSKNQKRRERHVETHRDHSNHNRRLDDAGRAQRRPHRDERELQHQRR